MRTLLNRLNPVVPRRALTPLAGVLWGAVAVMLLVRATGWLLAAAVLPAVLAGVGGIALGLFLIDRAFRPLVEKNLCRLADRPERACVFSVFAFRSWAMVTVMSVGGVLLRHSAVPKLALAGPYLAMSLCLGWGALRYLRNPSR